MPKYRLHYFPESGNSYKLAQMLTLCGQDFELLWSDFGARVTRTAEWRREVNPMGEIPVLEEDDKKMTQTGPILLYLAEKFGRFGGRDASERFEILRWLFWDNHKLSGMTATYRFLRTFTADADPAVLAWLRSRVDDFLGILNTQLDERQFVVGEDPTIADISMCAYLSYPVDETGFDLGRTCPNVQRWLDRLSEIPGWAPPYALLPGQRMQRYV